MLQWFIIFPVAGALLGWFFNQLITYSVFRPLTERKILGLKFLGMVPRHRASIIKAISTFAAKEFSLEAIETKISDPSNFEKLRPMIETHVDEFLNVKLAKEMPFISMFIGSKTITSLKATFMNELESLFPQVMKNYVENLKTEFDIQAMIQSKLDMISIKSIESRFLESMNRPLLQFKLAGASAGLIIGLINAFLLLLIS